MEDRAWDVFLAVLSAWLGAWFSKRAERPKEKASKPLGKHFRRP